MSGGIEQPLLPGFPAISVAYWTTVTDERTGERIFGIRYCGFERDLIAAGVATAGLFVARRPGAGNGRVDADGDRVSLDRYFRSVAGSPIRCYRLIIWKRQQCLARLPGAVAAMLKFERNCREIGYESGVTDVVQQLEEDNAAVMSAAGAEFDAMWKQISAPRTIE